MGSYVQVDEVLHLLLVTIPGSGGDVQGVYDRYSNRVLSVRHNGADIDKPAITEAIVQAAKNWVQRKTALRRS